MKTKITLLAIILMMMSGVETSASQRVMPNGAKAETGSNIDANAFWRQKRHRGANDLVNVSTPLQRVKKVAATDSRMPKRAMAAQANIEGYMVYHKSQDYTSWWKLNTSDASSAKLWSNSEIEDVTAGFVVDETVYGYYYYDLMGLEYAESRLLQFDVSTGELKNTMELDVRDYSTMVLAAAYDEKEEMAYVYTYSADHYSVYFQKMNIKTGEFTKISELELFVSNPIITMAYNPVDGQLYGITFNGYFSVIDKTTGEYTDDCNIGFYPLFIPQAMVYSPFDRGFIYAATENNEAMTPWLLLIDPEEKSVVWEKEMYEEEEYSILYCSDPLVENGAPDMPLIQSIEFEGASTSGRAVIILPEATIEGNRIDGQLTVEISIDGVRYGEVLTKDSGETITVELNNIADGLHELVVATSHNGVAGVDAKQNFFVGKDTPEMPQNVVLTETKISWDKVTTGANGGYVEVDKIKYNVYLNGELQNASPISETTYSITLTDDEVMLNKAEIEAVYEEKVSKKGVSNELLTGAYSIPVDFDMSHDLMPFVEVRDGNSDGCTWSYNEEKHAIQYDYSETNAGNDWAIFPPVRFEETELVYEIEVDACTYSDVKYPEALEVALCKSEDIRERFVILPKTTVNSSAGVTLSAKFTVPSTGDYKVWLHAVSPADSFWLRVTSIRIKKSNSSVSAPGECTDITAEGAAYGQLQATVKFNIPVSTIDGKELNADDDITVLAYSEAGYSTVIGKPGSAQEVVVATKQGENTISLKPSNSAGEGKIATVSVFTGVDIPGMATIAYQRVSEDNRSVTFGWETSTVGENGGFVDPAFMTYQITRYDEERDYWWALSEPGYEGTEYTYTIEEGVPLKIERLGIISTNAAGSTTASEVMAASLGTPYKLPMIENFETGDVSFNAIMIERPSSEYSGTWTVDNPRIYVNNASHAHSTSLIALPTEGGETYSLIALSKFTTKNVQSASAKFNVYFYEGMATAEVCLRDYNGNEYSMGEIKAEFAKEGWNEVEFVVPSYGLDREWVEIIIRAKFTGEDQFLIVGGYEIKNTSSVENIEENEGELFGSQGNITFKNFDNQFVRIYSTDGKILLSQTIDATFVVMPMQPGIYMVRYGMKSKKVIVK